MPGSVTCPEASLSQAQTSRAKPQTWKVRVTLHHVKQRDCLRARELLRVQVHLDETLHLNARTSTTLTTTSEDGHVITLPLDQTPLTPNP
jgi:hypothetical protein